MMLINFLENKIGEPILDKFQIMKSKLLPHSN